MRMEADEIYQVMLLKLIIYSREGSRAYHAMTNIENQTDPHVVMPNHGVGCLNYHDYSASCETMHNTPETTARQCRQELG